MSTSESNHGSDGRFLPGTHWRPHAIFREADYLVEQYKRLGRSMADIAKEHGVTVNAIFYWLARHGIKRRSVSEARQCKHWGSYGEANPMFGRTGTHNPRYVDGSSPERQRLYASARGREFIHTVLKRDGYACCRCGDGKTTWRSLHVHHICSWAGNPGMRFDIANAVTLCRLCHNFVHSRANEAREWLS